mgnify:FL=1
MQIMWNRIEKSRTNSCWVHWSKFEEVNIFYTPAVSKHSLYPLSSPIILKNQMQSSQTFLMEQIAHEACSRAYLFVKMKDEKSVDFFYRAIFASEDFQWIRHITYIAL